MGRFTHLRTDQLKMLTIILGVWVGLALWGTVVSRWGWSSGGGVIWFDVSWISRVAFLCCSLVAYFIWRRSGKMPIRYWLLLGVPFILTELLLWKIHVAVRNFAVLDSNQWLSQYSIYYTTFAVVVAAWILVFPCEELWGRIEGQWERVGWHAVLSIVAATICVIVYTRNFQFTHASLGEVSPSRMQLFQLWMQSITRIIFVFMIGRLLIPVTLTCIAKTFGGES